MNSIHRLCETRSQSLRSRATCAWSHAMSGLPARMSRIRPPKPRRSASMMWPTHSLTHHSPALKWNRQPSSPSAVISASISAQVDSRRSPTSVVVSGRSASGNDGRRDADRNVNIEHDGAVGARLVRGVSLEQLETLAAPQAGLELAVGREVLAVGLQQDVQLLVLPGHPEHEILGRGLLDPLHQRVLDQAEDRDLVVRGETAVAAGAGEVDPDTVLV